MCVHLRLCTALARAFTPANCQPLYPCRRGLPQELCRGGGAPARLHGAARPAGARGRGAEPAPGGGAGRHRGPLLPAVPGRAARRGRARDGAGQPGPRHPGLGCAAAGVGGTEEAGWREPARCLCGGTLLRWWACGAPLPLLESRDSCAHSPCLAPPRPTPSCPSGRPGGARALAALPGLHAPQRRAAGAAAGQPARAPGAHAGHLRGAARAQHAGGLDGLIPCLGWPILPAAAAHPACCCQFGGLALGSRRFPTGLALPRPALHRLTPVHISTCPSPPRLPTSHPPTQAMALMLPHTGHAGGDSTVEGRLASLSEAGYLPVAKSSAELGDVLDRIKVGGWVAGEGRAWLAAAGLVVVARQAEGRAGLHRGGGRGCVRSPLGSPAYPPTPARPRPPARPPAPRPRRPAGQPAARAAGHHGPQLRDRVAHPQPAPGRALHHHRLPPALRRAGPQVWRGGWLRRQGAVCCSRAAAAGVRCRAAWNASWQARRELRLACHPVCPHPLCNSNTLAKSLGREDASGEAGQAAAAGAAAEASTGGCGRKAAS